MLSANGKTVSATILSLEATTHLSSQGDLRPEHVSSRQVLADDVSALLFEGGRVRQRMVRANQLSEKLAFILETVSQWVNNGGFGRVDEDHGGDKISWEGLAVRDQNARKVERITVGRAGGDDIAAEREVMAA